ncbi:hypothetical protein [Niallia sp. NCCP-28]|uniref:hypothetical protein n=1 Tax=Niallia sp. NCCP-28 TaxID=2934712 RepID=UPI00208B2AD7|nr:hypothetical protein [Niallia sp. NCCP-28]GKU83260.1 hypothetical protein NCCP28_26560 [Niallia sp. NCCP-28]
MGPLLREMTPSVSAVITEIMQVTFYSAYIRPIEGKVSVAASLYGKEVKYSTEIMKVNVYYFSFKQAYDRIILSK